MGRKHQCDICYKKFERSKGLRRHIKYRRKILECEHCNRKFCNIDNLQKHLRSVRSAGISKNIDLNSSITPRTGFENDIGFKNVFQENISKICGKISNFKRYQVYNIEIDSSFTYKRLHDILVQIYSSQKQTFKINLGFGFILKNVVTSKYRYYYNGINNLIFETAFPITSRRDIETFFEKLKSVDLITTYYLKKPSSNWIFCGLVNIEIFIYALQDTLIGAPILLPKYIKEKNV